MNFLKLKLGYNILNMNYLMGFYKMTFKIHFIFTSLAGIIFGPLFSTFHLSEFPIGSYLKVTDSTKSLVTFLVLVRGIFLLYHLKAYLYSFILTRDSKFLGAPFMVKN